MISKIWSFLPASVLFGTSIADAASNSNEQVGLSLKPCKLGKIVANNVFISFVLVMTSALVFHASGGSAAEKERGITRLPTVADFSTCWCRDGWGGYVVYKSDPSQACSEFDTFERTCDE